PAPPQQAERPAVRGTVPLAPQEQQPRRQQDLPTVVEPDLGAGSSDLDVPDFLK
ncbi:cell division protein FtsZ, partial [Micrococcus sp. MS-ASIII-49]